ncbi:killer cell lectin-like receptor subfamily G member 1 isoform X1 [Pezoporus flaviventris]|uniref:killer cell lectin-like receptor subfamily G member 1 isoform X1 n=1 Tax=Pezoporus flaviventris TaxID=889875 RepID=UPI002AB1A35D|nr:killer cell lectin-like receptor subfamily G member 1 isoform X1 [Pezoporus flaviventris]XP_061328297.1 killer cell lectin-like receptor subfamily G member 1 isoform X1 [Pezoporus flaviventris]XP_061328298.1 killer cell lectin-like receptor subfamily G member 1 isoform X1 [Pezoporus flaviventris]
MHHLFCYHISASSCGNKENSDPDLDFVPSWTSKCQVKQSKKKQHLKAHDRNKEEHIYLNVKHSPSSKKQMMRRQRTEENITNKDFPGLCTSCHITAVILGILILVSLGTALGFIIKGYPCPSCPEQWVAYRGSCYSFSKQKKDWNSSRQSCGAQGAHLLVISDTSEMDFFQMMHTESYWIGLQNSTGYDWVWEDGSKLNGKNVLFNSPVQNCGVLLDGAIRASSCEILAPWICEKSLQ